MEENQNPSVKERLERHAECLREERYPVVFCVRCGSTHIDQNSLTELRCYDCGNTLAWDGSRFGVNRYATEVAMPDRFRDAANAFRLEDRR
jgi:hypothetical protein